MLSGKTLSCGCLNSSSGEFIIENILKQNKITYTKEFSFYDLNSPKNRPLRFDFAIFINNKLSHLIEFDGKQHFDNESHFNESAEEIQYRKICDSLKNEYCKKNNIPLIRIPYYKKNDISLKDLLL